MDLDVDLARVLKTPELASAENPIPPADCSDVALLQHRYYPATRYFGSKRKLLSWYEEEFSRLDFDTVLDVFGGTGLVSLMFQYMGKQVAYNDALRFNAICAKAFLSAPHSKDVLLRAAYLINSIVPMKGGVISRRFNDLYYLQSENEWLDGAAFTLAGLRESKLKSLVSYALAQACLMKRPFNLFHRANLYIRQNVPDDAKFGNATTWNTEFSKLAIGALFELARIPKGKSMAFNVLPPQDASLIPAGYDLVYIDPPYVTKDRVKDDYLRQYHFLEGFFDYSNWEKRIDDTLRTKALFGMPHLAEWNAKKSFVTRLDCLLEQHRHSICVMSYVDDAYPSRDGLKKLFARHFSSVRTVSRTHKHALTTKKKRELLIIAGG